MRWSRSCNPFEDRRVVLAALGMVAAACLLASCTMPALTRLSPQHFPQPDSCAHCHVDIHEEWKLSPHARAFTNERYRHATDDYAFQECLGCHAPQPMLVRGEPAVRPVEREIGVGCVSCHLDNGAMVGPLQPTGLAKPHPIKVDPAPFENGKLCGHCHQGELRQWQASTIEGKQDCRHCHMPTVRRTMTQATSLVSKAFVAAEKAEIQHRHTFMLVPGKLPEPPFTLDVAATGDQMTIALTNRLPHNLPTGDFGVRIVQIEALGIDSHGASASLGRWELTNFGAGALPSGQSRHWSVPRSPDLRALRLQVARQGRDGADRVVLLQKEVPLP